MIQLNTISDFPESGISAQYFIAQHMPDIMRKEKRNVGVLVRKGSTLAARFVGEKEPGGTIDGRTLRNFSDPQLYKMWVRYWRKEMLKESWQAKLLESERITYNFITGGEVTDSGADTADQIANYLYSLLVAETNLSEALGAADSDPDEVAEIKADFHAELRKLKLLSSIAPANVRNPVYENWPVRGATTWHQLSFFQESTSEAWVYEPLNLTTRAKQHMRERAGYLAYIFSDLHADSEKINKPVNTSVILRVHDGDKDEASVKYALQVVENHAEIIDWSSPKQRKEVLNRCENFAVAV